MEEGYKKVIEWNCDKFCCVVIVERLFLFLVVSNVVILDEV